MKLHEEPELRRDPVSGRWVLVAPERARRPIALSDAAPRRRTDDERTPCPFCSGQEHETTNEVFAYREPGSVPNGPGWRLRVVSNKFPAVKCAEPTPPSPLPARRGMSTRDASSEHPEANEFQGSFSPSLRGGGRGVGLFEAAPAIGFAEVLIDCPEHVDDPALLSDEQFRDVFRAYRDRMMALAGDTRLAYVAAFKNVGAEAGASLGHTHSQLIATPVVPDLIQRELAGAHEHFACTGRCVFCDIVKEEIANGSRVVARSANFVALAAFAPRFAYETWLLPVRHEARYEAITESDTLELAHLLKRVLRALDAVQNSPAYNWFLHTSPLRAGELPHYHWHLEVLPRTSRPAGLEWGHGCHITTTTPECAAAELRATLPG